MCDVPLSQQVKHAVGDEVRAVVVLNTRGEDTRRIAVPHWRSWLMQLHLFNQRWRERRESYRPREPIQTQLYEVAPIPGNREAKDFVLRHHYSGTYPAARFR